MDWREAFVKSAVMVVDEEKYERLVNTYMVGGEKVQLTNEAMTFWKPPLFHGIRVPWLRKDDPLFQSMKNRLAQATPAAPLVGRSGRRR